jgi:spore maturation protein CgeB
MKAPGSVLIVGPTSPESLESSYARAFDKTGWAVHRWTPATALAAVARGSRVGRAFARFVRVDAWDRKANLELLRLVDSSRPDVLLIVDTGGVRAGTLGQIRACSPATALVCLYPDSPHNLDPERIASLPLFDLVTTSSPAWVRIFERLGARNTRYLPFGADTDLHSPGEPNERYRADISFVGTWRPEREQLLEALADFDLQIWGNEYWRTRTRRGSPLRSRWSGRPLPGNELGAVCASSRIMLNIMDPATWPGPNMRTFEQAACAAFSLTTRTPAVLELFSEGVNIECFNDAAEARAKIERYLADDVTRRRIAASGRDFVIAGHTYAQRCGTLLQWLGGDAAPRGSRESERVS